MNEPFRDRLHKDADSFEPGRPDVAKITHRGRVRKMRRTAATGAAGILSLFAVAVPLYLLSGLGHPSPGPGSGTPASSPPIAFTEILSRPKPPAHQPPELRIALMRPDGSGVQQVTTGREPDAYQTKFGYSQDLDPQWAPNGLEIYFLRRYNEYTYSLCAVRPSGSGFRVVVRDFPAADFAISPSGTQIAYSGGGGLSVIGIDGSSPHRIYRYPHLGLMISPTWSPDGKQLAFISGANQISVTDVSPIPLTHVINTSGPLEGVVWDPTGNLIAYTVLDGKFHDSVWTVRPDGSGARQLMTGTGSWMSIAWSPDGSQLLIGRLDSRLRDSGLAVVDSDGTGVQVIIKKALSAGASWRR